MNRNPRQQKLIDIIEKSEIETQTDLTNALKSAGFEVTQATVSRDIKELGVVKTGGKLKKYRYTYPRQNFSEGDKQYHMFRNSMLSVQTSLNLIVCKTMVGSANSACALVDKMGIPTIIGSIAGDDNFILIIDKVENVEEVASLLRSYIHD